MKKQELNAARRVSIAGCGGGSQSTSPPPKYTVGGMVSGLSTGSTLVLSNQGANSISVSTNGAFTFPTSIALGSQYAVAVN